MSSTKVPSNYFYHLVYLGPMNTSCKLRRVGLALSDHSGDGIKQIRANVVWFEVGAALRWLWSSTSLKKLFEQTALPHDLW